ncbi:MAG: serine protease [Acidobacteriota bacterium]
MKNRLTKVIAGLALAILTVALSSRPSFGQNPVTLETDPATRGSVPFEDTVRRYLQNQQPKIIGGKPAPPGAFPWQVSLGVSWIADPFSAHFCGGSVLSGKWVVTAAHCAERLNPGQVVVTAGTNQLVAGTTRRNVNRIIVHRSYDRQNQDNDIALLELHDPLPTGLAIQTVELLKPGDESGLGETSLFTVVGWGATVEGGGVVRDLRFLDVLPFVPRTVCNSPQAYDGRITANMICAGVRAGGQDSCQGDSGGPLTFGTGTSSKLAGIVSWGDGCARPDKVGVYTRVSNYVDWIQTCVSNSAACNQ